MDSPPSIIEPLRTILLETVSEEKVDAHRQVFYRESAECRFRPLPNNFKDLKLLDDVAVLTGIFYRPAQ